MYWTQYNVQWEHHSSTGPSSPPPYLPTLSSVSSELDRRDWAERAGPVWSACAGPFQLAASK